MNTVFFDSNMPSTGFEIFEEEELKHIKRKQYGPVMIKCILIIEYNFTNLISRLLNTLRLAARSEAGELKQTKK